MDSFVESLLKNWIANGKREDTQLNAFKSQIEIIFHELADENNGTFYLGTRELSGKARRIRRPSRTMEHLACFFPGVLALAGFHDLGGGLEAKNEASYIIRAQKLTHTCFQMSRSNNLQWGKIMWNDIERSTTLSSGRLTSTSRLDQQELSAGGKIYSFVFAETLKNFYLLFKGRTNNCRFNFENWIFNTEAHPVPIVSS